MSTPFALRAEEYTPFENVEARNGIQSAIEIPLLIRALRLFPAARILEVGCGRGIALPVISARLGPQQLVGIDIDPSLVALANERVAVERVDATILEADVRSLPFESGSFDLVFDFGTCYHVSGGTEGSRAALKEIARVLSPRGLFVHETRVAQRLAHPIRSFGRKLPWNAVSDLVIDRKAWLWGAHRKLAACALFLVLSVVGSAPLRAQSDSVSAAAEGRVAGRAAADKREVVSRGIGAFFAGLPVGFFGPFAFTDADAVQVVPTFAGVAGIATAALGSAEAPAGVRAIAESHGKDYARSFDDAYAHRLRVRRGVAALIGGATGTAAGFGLLVWLLSHIDT